MTPFSKYSGLGNDFIFFDNRDESFPIDISLIQNLCNRHQGIGADGVILVENSELADVKMRIFNADGTEAEMCGNGLRCFYLYLKELGFTQERFQVQTMHKIHSVSQIDDRIYCGMGDVENIQSDISIFFNKHALKGYFLNTGVPHFVVPTDDLQKLPVQLLGCYLRHHEKFKPHGTNVNFISKNSDNEIEIRTYERGVEKETKACGTGCAAAAIIASKIYSLEVPIIVKPSEGESLIFEFKCNSDIVSELTMIGGARYVFSGQIAITQLVNN